MAILDEYANNVEVGEAMARLVYAEALRATGAAGEGSRGHRPGPGPLDRAHPRHREPALEGLLPAEYPRARAHSMALAEEWTGQPVDGCTVVAKTRRRVR